MQELENHFSFSQELLDEAMAFPNGSFVQVDDMIYEANHLGRKIIQTQLAKIGGKEVSIGALGGDGTTHELVVASENPVAIGSFEEVMKNNMDIFTALHQVFGGSVSNYHPIEMVIAIHTAVAEGVSPADADRLASIAGDARVQVKRGAWIASNHMAAFVQAPLDWRSLGL